VSEGRLACIKEISAQNVDLEEKTEKCRWHSSRHVNYKLRLRNGNFTGSYGEWRSRLAEKKKGGGLRT